MSRFIILIINMLLLVFIAGCSNTPTDPVVPSVEPETPEVDYQEILTGYISDFEAEFLVEEVKENFELASNINDATISWRSSNEEVIKIEGNIAKVNRQDESVVVTLIAVFTLEDVNITKNYDVKVLAINNGSSGWLPWV